MQFLQTLLLRLLAAACIFGTAACQMGSGHNSPPPVADPLTTSDQLSHRKGVLRVTAKPGSTVEIRQIRHEFWFGAALANQMFGPNADPETARRYKTAFLENFNAAVTENALKWGSMQRTPEPPDYSTVDAILEWTELNEIPLRGHNIFWGVSQFVQPWVKALDDDALEATLEARARDIGTRYRGRFTQYDLNNEMIHGNYYADRLGDDITAKMATWVKQSDPDAQLYLNDYDILTGNALDAYLEQISDLLDQDVPISGIGVQGHLHGDHFDPNVLQSSLDQLAQFGLPIIITEFNFPGQTSKFYEEPGLHQITPAEEATKAQAITDYYRICFAHPAVDGILMWGFWGDANWIPESSLYRKDWSPTPALAAYRDLVFKEWWTTATATANANGVVEIPAFFGRYEITADGQTFEADLRKVDGFVIVP